MDFFIDYFNEQEREEWEAGRRKPPEYIPRLIKYQIMYEQQFDKQFKSDKDSI